VAQRGALLWVQRVAESGSNLLKPRTPFRFGPEFDESGLQAEQGNQRETDEAGNHRK
jgi:hypothetical protein